MRVRRHGRTRRGIQILATVRHWPRSLSRFVSRTLSKKAFVTERKPTDGLGATLDRWSDCHMDILFLLVAFAGVFLAMFRSLGTGFLAVIAVGYFNGVIRANYLGVFTTFMFDAAVLGLYLGFFLRRSLRARRVDAGLARPFVLFLIAWPAFLCLVPVNHFLVQCVALRADIWFLPVLLIAARLTTADLAVLARGLVVLNLVALAVGVYINLIRGPGPLPGERDHTNHLQLE